MRELFFFLMLFAGSVSAGVFHPLYCKVTETTFAGQGDMVAVFKALSSGNKEDILERTRGCIAVAAGTPVYVSTYALNHGLIRVQIGEPQSGGNTYEIPFKYLKEDDSPTIVLPAPRPQAEVWQEALKNMTGQPPIEMPLPVVPSTPIHTMWDGNPGSSGNPGRNEQILVDQPLIAFKTHEEALTFEACLSRTKRIGEEGRKDAQALYDNLVSRAEASKIITGDFYFILKEFPDRTSLIIWTNRKGEQRMVFSFHTSGDSDYYLFWPNPPPQPLRRLAPPPAAEMPMPVAVAEPTPQPAPAPLPMKLEMPTPTPPPQAPKSRWNTHGGPTAEEAVAQDLRDAENEFYSAHAFTEEQNALLKPEEDGWTAYLASIQDPATKAKALRERAKYLRECQAYFKYYEQYQAYCTWCKANGKPVPPPLEDSTAAVAATPMPVSTDLAEQEKAAEQEYRDFWTPLTDDQRIALFQEESQFDLAFRKLHDFGSPADRINAYKEEIGRMKAILARMTGPTDPATAEKLKQKMAELDAVWNSLPPEQQQRVQPGQEGWLAAIKTMAPPDQVRETEKRIKFLNDNLGQFMRTPGAPPPAEDPVLQAQLLQKQAILDALVNALPEINRKQYAAGMKVMHDHDASLPITQRIQHLDVEIQSLQQAAEYLKAMRGG
jgi:hypothetical protein